MAYINLLPWREERRRQLTQEFLRQMVLVALFAGVIGGYSWYHVTGLVDNQQARNRYLQEQISILQDQIEQIQKLEATKRQLLARMNVIQRLQQRRPQIVHLFHELADTLPDGVYLTGVTQKGDSLKITGRAESNSRVSTYMRNLDASPWLQRPQLQVIKTGANDRVNSFTLNLAQTTPDDDKQAAAKQSGSSSGKGS